jgi:MoxR-like ATPase
LVAQQIVRHIPVGEKVVDSILKLVRAARPGDEGAKDVRDAIAWGPGPRASQAFMLAVRARALVEGRLAPSTDDVVALAQPVLRHRMALTFPARAEGMTVPSVIDRLCRSLL